MGNNNNNRIEIHGNYPNGYWWIREYDFNNNEIYYEDSDGRWVKYEYEYDSNNNLIYYEDSDGYWYKYDSNDGIIDYGQKDLFPTPEEIKQYIENGK